MHRCISFKFWSSVLSKPFVWFFLEQSSGSLSIPRDKRSSSGHLCSYMTRANGQSGPRAPEQMFTSVSLCKRKLMEPQIKNLMKTLLLLIWRGVPEGTLLKLHFWMLSEPPKAMSLDRLGVLFNHFIFNFSSLPSTLEMPSGPCIVYLLIADIIIFWHLPWTWVSHDLLVLFPKTHIASTSLEQTNP